MPFLQKFWYVLWIGEQAEGIQQGDLKKVLAWNALPPLSLIVDMPGFAPFFKQAMH